MQNYFHQNQSKKMMLGRLHPPNTWVRGGLFPQEPDAFVFNLPNQLVIGYHWLAFLNRQSTLSSKSQFTRSFEYKIDHNSKNKNRKIDYSLFQHIAYLPCKYDHF